MKKQILLSIILLLSCCSLSFAGCLWAKDGNIYREWCQYGASQWWDESGRCSASSTGSNAYECPTIEGIASVSIEGSQSVVASLSSSVLNQSDDNFCYTVYRQSAGENFYRQYYECCCTNMSSTATGNCSYYESGAYGWQCAGLEGATALPSDLLASLAPDGTVSIRIVADGYCPDTWSCPKDTRYDCTRVCLDANGWPYTEYKPNVPVIAPATGGLAYIPRRTMYRI
jgi:hypothetical protein